MMNKTKRTICGTILILLSVAIVLNLTDVFHFNLMFDGWWSLFIIIPCLFGLIFDKQKTGPIFGIGVGVLLLLCAQDIINWVDLWKFLIALFAFVWGLTMILGKGQYWGKDNTQTVKELKLIDRKGRQIREISGSFTGRNISFNGESFEGADVKVSFGAMALDLRGADILDGAVITINCSFAGMEIYVDPSVNVKIAMNCAFGGVDDKRLPMLTPESKTLYLEGGCSFAGIEVK